MSDLDLCYMPAHEALRRFKDRSLSPVDVMKAVIERAEEVEPTINAFTFKYFDEAMDKAIKAEDKYGQTGAQLGALEGLPVGIKDEGFIKGQPTSNASLTMKDFVPDYTSPVNQRVLDAGGIVHARTATPEFSCAGYTNSRMWGVTRNPWNPEFTPGGSSGGSAASLSAGTSLLATGSDIGGSVRIPASTTGLAGFKPPYGRNPDDGPLNLDFYCHTGPLARNVKDCAILQNVMCGPHPHDIATIRPKYELPLTYEGIDGWKIAYSPDLGVFEVDNEVRANTEAALETLRSLGATVEEVDLGWDIDILSALMDYLNHIFGAMLSSTLEEHADDLTDYARYFAEIGRDSTSTEFVNSLQVAHDMYKTLGPILEDYNLLVCPTTALPAVAADFNQVRDKVVINGNEVNSMLGWCMTTPFNALSRCPVLSVPTGRASNNVPTGLQLVGRTFCDSDVFQVAAAMEAVNPWFASADNRPPL